MQQQSKFMEGSYVYNNTEAYIQDNWKVSRRLTLDYGVRFVRQQPQHDALFQAANFLPETWDPTQAPRLYTSGCATNVFPCSTANQRAVDPNNPTVFLPRLALGQVVPNSGNTANGMHLVTGGRIVDTAYKWPLIAPAPRFGMAYDLTGEQKVVLRGGAGLFFDRPQGTTIYSLVTNPPVTQFVTLSNGSLRDLGTGLRLSGAPQLSVYEYDAPLPSSTQWNAGAQIALPWSSAIDLSYVGQHGFNLLRNVNINQVEPGMAWLPRFQDPAQTPTTLGSNALPDVLMRPFTGYGNINMQLGIGSNTYHSIQSSFNRRFSRGLSFTLNHTLALSNRGNLDSPVRLKYAADRSYSFRDDQAQADELLGQLQMQRNTYKGTFSWDLPDVAPSTSALRVLGAVINDWQLSGVASYQTGNLYNVGYTYTNGGSQLNITGSPSYNGRVIITGDHGGVGCSSDQYKQFNTSVFAGPPVGSVGLESGQNYLTGCWDKFWDFSIARTVRLGSGRQVQLRVDMFNAFDTVSITARNTTMQLASPTDQTLGNPQYDAAGNLVQTRLEPENAGFGAATGAAALRSVQAQIRFQF